MVAPENAPRLDEWLTATEVAEMLGVSRQTVNDMLKRGEFASLHRVGQESAKPLFVVSRAEAEQVKKTRTFRRR